MISIEEVKKHYFFTEKDEKNLRRLGKIISPYADQFALDFSDYLVNYPETAPFFRTKEGIEKRQKTIKEWLLRLFEGGYNRHYINELYRIGSTHVKRNIPIHFVVASMNFKRDYLIDILEKEIGNKTELRDLIRSLEKILDINLDIITSSYHEEELKRIFLTKRMDSALITFGERFTYGLNLILILALMGLSLGVIFLFAKDIYTLVFLGNLERGILSSLGTLLIIWVMVELMGTEIKYLKGERFHLEIFISVALVATIRELLISILAHESLPKLGVFLFAVLVLGVIYHLISKTEFPR